jgi:hypothetical protein
MEWEAQIDNGARDRADGIVKEALRVLMQGTSISPQEEDSPGLRANIAIRSIVHILYDQSEEYHLPGDLKAALSFIAGSLEDELPDWLRREWEMPDLSIGYAHHVPNKP